MVSSELKRQKEGNYIEGDGPIDKRSWVVKCSMFKSDASLKHMPLGTIATYFNFGA